MNEITTTTETTIINTPEVDAVSTKQDDLVVVIYNRHAMESVLAAAIIKSKYPYVQVFEANLLIPGDADKYYWLGVLPSQGVFNTKETWNATHLVSTPGYPTREFTMKMGRGMYRDLIADTIEYHANSAGRFLDYLRINEEKYLGLVDSVHMFYDKNMDLDMLAFIYMNLKNALSFLENGGEFKVEPQSKDQVKEYLEHVKRAKLEVKNNYAIKEVSIKGKHSHVFITCNVKDFWLVRRLSGFVYDTFVNTSMMLRGPSVHSNIDVSQIIDFSNVTSTA